MLLASDPFAVTADPAGYLPRPATEQALGALEGAVRRGQRCSVLSGPPGIGKTLLLRVLEQRLSDAACCVFLPYAALSPADLCRWALGLLDGGEPRDTPAPEHALLAEARSQADRGRALVLLLDDASALPPETARALLRLCDQAAGALRLVVVPVDDRRAGRVVAALGADAFCVRLVEGLDAHETEAYLYARLDRCGASEALLRHFDTAQSRRLWRESGGNPRLLHAAATAHLRSAESPAGPDAAPETAAGVAAAGA